MIIIIVIVIGFGADPFPYDDVLPAPSFHPFRGNFFTCAFLTSPYPRLPALSHQDTTFTWRLADAVTCVSDLAHSS